jgi:hypothetical protein
MAINKILICDLCKAEQPEHYEGHWSQRFGAVKLDFSGMPGLQWKAEYPELCLGCAKQLSEAISGMIDKLRKG